LEAGQVAKQVIDAMTVLRNLCAFSAAFWGLYCDFIRTAFCSGGTKGASDLPVDGPRIRRCGNAADCFAHRNVF
jgi:hypothetical protein